MNLRPKLPCQGKNNGICKFDKHGTLICKAAIPREELLPFILALILGAEEVEAPKFDASDWRIKAGLYIIQQALKAKAKEVKSQPVR